MKKTILYFIFLLNSFFFYRCGKENYQLGVEKQDFTSVKINVEKIADWQNNIEIKTIEHPLFYSYGTRALLGQYENDLLGNIKYNFYTGLYINQQRPENYQNAIIDSVKIFLAYQNDTVDGLTKNDTPLSIQLHTVTEKIKAPADKKYTVLDSIIKKDPIQILEQPTSFDTKDSITLDEKKYAALAISIDTTFIKQNVWNLSDFTQEELEKKIPGLVFEVAQNSGVASFNLNVAPSKMRIFYSLEGKTSHLDLYVYQNNQTFTRIQKTFDDTKTAFDGSGFGFQINLQNLQQQFEKIAINKVTLSIPYAEQENVRKISSSDLDIFIQNENDELSSITSLNSESIILNEDEKKYQILLTLPLNKLLLGQEKETILWIVPKFLSAKTNALDFSQGELEVISSQFEK